MVLQVLWFALWGLLWAVYFMLDGFDFGVGMLRRAIARDEAERGMALAAIGPVWNGNEVWLVTAGGATFAAFPAVYASMFSFFYIPMLLILFSLILRGVAVELRGTIDNPPWRSVCDWVLAVTSLSAPALLGLAFGNLFQGVPLDAAGYHGSLRGLFNPYGLLTAALFVLLFLQHGALWLAFRTTGALAVRARGAAAALWVLAFVASAVFLLATGFATRLYDNFAAHPLLIVVPVLAVASLVAVRVSLAGGRLLGSFLLSSAAIVLVVATAMVGLFPNMIPSSTDPSASLTIYNSSSGPLTLRVMTIVVAIFVPVVVLYQILVYRFFRAKLTPESLSSGEGY